MWRRLKLSLLGLVMVIGLVLVLSPSLLSEVSLRTSRASFGVSAGFDGSDRPRPRMVREKRVPVEVPFDSYPFHAFNASAVYEVEWAPHPDKKTTDRSRVLDVRFPTSTRTVVCEGATFDNRVWNEGYTPVMVCNTPRPSDAKARVDRHLVVSYDAAHITFQHDMITGVPRAALFGDWVAENPEERGFLCQKVMTEILKLSFPSGAVLDRKNLPKRFWAPSIRFSRAPFDKVSDGCEPFPMGAFWPAEVFLREFRKSIPSPSSAVNVPKILFLSRGQASNSIRWMDNEDELIEAIRNLSRARGWAVEVVPHKVVGVSDQTTTKKTILQFNNAAAVVGLHGGAFSNVVFCNPHAVIIEINNNVKGRECFSGIALSRGIEYHRFQHHREFWYQSWDHFRLYDREIRQIVALLDVQLSKKLRKK